MATTFATRQNAPAVSLTRSSSVRTNRSVRPRDSLANGAPAVRLGASTAVSTGVSGDVAKLVNAPGAGNKLLPSIQTALENSLGVTLDPVRVHNDKRSGEVVDGIGARAFTYGPHIFLGSREQESDLDLMAHEAAHVVQQQGKPVLQMSSTSAPSTSYEIEANRTSQAVASGQPITVLGRTSSPQVQKKSLWDKVAGKVSGAIDSVVEWGEDKILDLINKYAPELMPIIKKGPVEYLKEKLSDAADALVTKVMAPIKSFTGIAKSLNSHFADLITWIRDSASKIARGDCKPIADAVEKIQKVIEGIATPIFDKVKQLAGKAKDFFTGLWDKFGAPVWKMLEDIGGSVLAKIKQVATWIWDKTEPVRNTLAKAWKWIKDKIGIGEGLEGQDGILQWVKKKAQAVWDEYIKPFVERFKKPLMAIGGVLLMLSPAGPFIAIGAGVAGLIYAIGWIRKYMRNTDLIPDQRNVFEKTIIPGINTAAKSISTALTKASTAIKNTLTDLLGGLGKAVGTLAGSILDVVAKGLEWVAERFGELLKWVIDKLNSFVTFVGDCFKKLGVFLEPVVTFLGKVAEVYINIVSIPIKILRKIWNVIPACIKNPFVDFLINRILKRVPLFKEIIETAPAAWNKIKAAALEILKKLFKEGDPIGALIVVFKLLLDALKVPVDLVKTIWTKAGNVIDQIVDKPVVFLTNILKTMKQGFFLFGKNILAHLASGITNWLLNAASEANIKPPTDMSFKSIFNFVLDVLDITVEKVFERIEKKVSKETYKKLRTAFNVLSKIWDWMGTLFTEGPEGVWKRLAESVGNIWDALVDGAIDWIIKKITKKAIEKVVTMLDPTGIMAVVNGLIAIYNAIESFVKYVAKILEIINSVLDTVTDVINGAIDGAAKMLENTMDRATPIVIGFLANQVGLGDIGKKLGEVIEAIRKKVVEGIDWLIDKAKAAIEKVGNAIKSGIKAVTEWWKMKKVVGSGANKFTLLTDGDESKTNVLVANSPAKEWNDYLKTVKATSPEQKAALTKAKNCVSIIGARRTLDPEPHADLIRKTFDELAEHIKILNDTIAKNDLPASVIEFSGTNGLEGGVEAKASILSKIHPKGSGPRDNSMKIWKDLEDLGKGLRPRKEVRKDWYVRGHLLNEELGGPGLRFNLTPITKEANNEHKRIVETELKKLVIEDDEVISYTVQALDGPPLGINPRLKFLTKKPKLTPDETDELVSLNALQNLSSGFKCTAYILEQETINKWTKKKKALDKATKTIPNNIDSGGNTYGY